LNLEEKNKMTIFKRKKRLEELDDCPDIKKGCAFADSGILSYCRDGNYANCLYRSKESEEEKYKKSDEEKS